MEKLLLKPLSVGLYRFLRVTAIQTAVTFRRSAEARLNPPPAFAMEKRWAATCGMNWRLELVDAMNRRMFLVLGAGLTLAACSSAAPTLGSDGRPLSRVYKIKPGDERVISFRLLDSVNTLRAARSVPPLSFDARLNAAAATHSRDMSVQNRPWHFGSDGSSPLLRVQRSGYTGRLVGELISETYETELETLSTWMAQPDTRAIIMDPAARFVGFAWFQEPNGKIWWTMVTGA